MKAATKTLLTVTLFNCALFNPFTLASANETESKSIEQPTLETPEPTPMAGLVCIYFPQMCDD